MPAEVAGVHLLRAIHASLAQFEADSRLNGRGLPAGFRELTDALAFCAQPRIGDRNGRPAPKVCEVPNMEPLLLTTRQAGTLLGLSPRKVQALIQNGRLRAVKADGSTRIRPSDLVDYVADLSPRVVTK